MSDDFMNVRFDKVRLDSSQEKMPTTQTSLSMPLLYEPPSELSVFRYIKSATNDDRDRKCRESYS